MCSSGRMAGVSGIGPVFVLGVGKGVKKMVTQDGEIIYNMGL
jgi:hypothetical protein